MANQIDPRLLAAALKQQAQSQPQWNPVLGFLLPLYAQVLASAVMEAGLTFGEQSQREDAAAAWSTALAAFRQIGFEYVHPLGCKMIDNESANERALNRGLDEAGKEAR